MSPRYNSRQYLPRKGTETHSHNDATLVDDDIDSRQYLPRKGTETGTPELNFGGDKVEFPTIFTPQGDGN